MKSKHRIFLKTNSQVRRFLWLERGNDGSIYLGHANSARSGKKVAHIDVPERGASVYLDAGTPTTQEELSGKYSFHDSGVINLPYITNGRRDRLRMVAIRDHEGFLPLLCVIPILPTKYPLSNAKVRPTDLVIDCGLNRGRCIGVVLFITFSKQPPPLCSALSEKGFSTHIVGVDSHGQKLCALLYFNDQFLGWPLEEFTLISHPDETGEITWPIAVPGY